MATKNKTTNVLGGKNVRNVEALVAAGLMTRAAGDKMIAVAKKKKKK